MAARGYSRDHRPDREQVVIALVVTPEGFPLSYEILAGNRAEMGWSLPEQPPPKIYSSQVPDVRPT